ncbi:MAG: hypothetical protein MH204_12480 [Fimbriimonadaceae bacterium]|nr:hypothetical protein [Fimbriimonadaceae bacterium]
MKGLWAVVAVAFGLSLTLSPLTSPTRISVKGADPAHEDQIRSDLGRLSNIAFARINRRWLAYRLDLLGAYDRFELRGSPLGSAVLDLTRSPQVARVEDESDQAAILVEAGMLVGGTDLSGSLRPLRLPSSIREPAVAWNEARPMSRSVRLLEEQGSRLQAGTTVVVGPGGGLIIELPNGRMINAEASRTDVASQLSGGTADAGAPDREP